MRTANMTPDPKPEKRIKDPAALRAYRLEMHNEPCERCERRRGEHAHHIRYRSQGGDDRSYNLLWLCAVCHDDIHAGRTSRYVT
jgi:hypothetical protein